MSAYFDIFPKLLFFFSEIYVFSIAHFKLEKEKLEKNQKVMTKKISQTHESVQVVRRRKRKIHFSGL